ncbi:MAG: hypothetical protein V4564_18240 [Pseudomonadota bacterium]|uniref:hypothetical protein n=1 Tax=Sphingomonas sp. ERG5 TaxID=1381597 RepID=UPI00126A531C|nr:hypothetical protein [Sphingomonas sp. ERG5]
MLGDIVKWREECLKEADSIFISIELLPGSSSAGYLAKITAVQRRKRYEAQIDRRSMIAQGMEGRALVPINADTLNGKPYWDVYHDMFKLRSSLIKHMFEAK